MNNCLIFGYDKSKNEVNIIVKNITLIEKSPYAELFLVRIFLYSN